jgi:hypothetical protein
LLVHFTLFFFEASRGSLSIFLILTDTVKQPFPAPDHFYYQGTKHTKSNWNVKIFSLKKWLLFHDCERPKTAINKRELPQKIAMRNGLLLNGGFCGVTGRKSR